MTNEERIVALEREVARLRGGLDACVQMTGFLSASAGRADASVEDIRSWLWEIAAALGMTWEYEHGCAFENPHLTSFYERGEDDA